MPPVLIAALIAMNYTFEPVVADGKLIMHVRLDLKGGPIETGKLVIPSAWGGATNLEKGITNLQNVHDADGVHISYDLVKSWVVPPTRADHYALLESEYFEFNTQNALVHPPFEVSSPVKVRFDWSRLPPTWSLATSFGTGKRVQSYRGPWGNVNNAVFAGGDFRIHRRKIAGRPLVLAIRGNWKFTDEEAAARIEKMIASQRAFWRDRDFPYYLVTLSTFGRSDGGAGGGGFTNAFALFLNPNSSFGYGDQSLLAHEIFHTWNPYKMGSLPNAGITMSWFTEGFTTYYQDVLLLRGGMLSFPDFVSRTNEYLRNYFLSPARNVLNQDVIDRHRGDSAVDDIPYSRGATTALWLDSAIRHATSGKASLDSVMFELVRQARRKKPQLNADRVFRAAAKYIDAAAVQQFREYAESGKTIEVPAAGLGPCATLQMDDIPPFDLGMDREALISRKVVSAVKPGSPAFQAGLRDGQQVTGTSIYWNDVSKPVTLTVKTGSGSRKIEYYARGTSQGLVPQYHLNAAASTDQGQCLAAGGDMLGSR